jgi:glucose/arabinose dehydrogenase
MVRFACQLLAVIPAAVLVSAAGCGSSGDPSPTPSCTPNAGTQVTTVEIAAVDDVPTLATSPPNDGRLFIVERSGAIRIVQDGALLPTPFIDLDDNAGGPVAADGEMGLLGLAFHPDYDDNRRFYVYYTREDDGQIADEVAEYLASEADPNVADPATARIVLTIPDFAGNHNGGMIEFGDDDYLYVSTGDGGGGGDPQRTAQDVDRLLGKMLRIDVDVQDGGRAYGIPEDNPFADGVGGAPEVFMYGLRNPWRWSFDRETGDIYIGDVGQEAVEEIDVVTAAAAPGADFGWSECEGTLDFYAEGGCATPASPRHAPVYEQIRAAGGGDSNWSSVIGGEVYRGTCFSGLTGRYFYSDNGAGGVWSLVWTDGVVSDAQRHDVDVPGGPSFIYGDATGELYIGFGNGAVHRIEAR